jgi:uncharacterized protein YcfJ
LTFTKIVLCYRLLLIMGSFFRKYWALPVLLLCTGCDTTESSLGGAALGTAAGLGVGHALGGRGGAAAGAVVGGLAGAGIGHHVGRTNEEKNAYATENTRLRSEATNVSSGSSDLRMLEREVELKRLKNEKLEQEIAHKRLKKEKQSLEGNK